MRERYLPHVTDVYQRLADKLNHEESLPQQQRSKHIDKLQSMKTNIEQLIQVLSLRKRNIMPILKDYQIHQRDLNEIYQRVAAKLQQEDSLPQHKQRSDQFEKLKRGKTVLEGMLRFLSLSKSNIKPDLKDSMDYRENNIMIFLNMQSLRKTVQKLQFTKSEIQPMQQPLSQTVQDQSHDDQTTLQMQSMSMQGAGSRVQQIRQGVLQSLEIGTPGISASPLLPELTSPDGNIINPLTSTCGKSTATELPIERLIRAMKSISPQALSSAVCDIRSVVSMVDRIAGSVPGKGSRASFGVDLVAMTKCHLQERNFMTQEGMMATMKRKRQTTPMPSSVLLHWEEALVIATSSLLVW
ncbi:unnamed protein product [Arabidopsis thaliana]|uniref:(thale cress) hypothetical protein n=1 Tax=Arabidopsis thaliana TaxID=3702 RepID=A0A7G2DQX7_ARATH|nr:unnamed protein product [Arabidopsis thaliana]